MSTYLSWYYIWIYINYDDLLIEEQMFIIWMVLTVSSSADWMLLFISAVFYILWLYEDKLTRKRSEMKHSLIQSFSIFL